MTINNRFHAVPALNDRAEGDWKTGDRSQESGGRCQKAEVRGQKSGVRNNESEIRALLGSLKLLDTGYFLRKFRNDN